jgi:Raf kinase inhibitor-like YbhB/YbcL family protein
MSVKLTSAAFQEGGAIPKQYTADGRNLSPPLKWRDPPAEAKSFAVVCEDPDAPRGTFTHWVLYNLPAESRQLGEGVAPEAADGATPGVNDFGKAGYGGPSPPPGKPHHYVFKLYALDGPLDLRAGATKSQLLTAAKGHVLAEGQLTGMYGR